MSSKPKKRRLKDKTVTLAIVYGKTTAGGAMHDQTKDNTGTWPADGAHSLILAEAQCPQRDTFKKTGLRKLPTAYFS